MTNPKTRFDLHFTDLLALIDDHGVPRPPDAAATANTHPARYAEYVDDRGSLSRTDLSHTAWRAALLDLAQVLGEVLGPADVVVVAAPYEMSFAAATFERAVELTGASVIGVGTSDTICPQERVLRLIDTYAANVLICDPRRACDLAARAVEDGTDPRSLTITTVIAVGATHARRRFATVGDLWGAATFSVFNTATLPLVAAPCAAQRLHLRTHRLTSTLHHPTPGRLHRNATRGELMLTPYGALVRTAQPTGELVELLDPADVCPCGQSTPALLSLGPIAETIPTPDGPVGVIDVETQLARLASDTVGLVVRVATDGFLLECDPQPETSKSQLYELGRELSQQLGVDIDVDITSPSESVASAPCPPESQRTQPSPGPRHHLQGDRS